MSEEEVRNPDGKSSGFGPALDPEQQETDERRIEEFAMLIPERVAVAILRAAHADMEATATDAQRVLAEQVRSTGLRNLRASVLIPGNHTWLDVESDFVQREVPGLRRALVTAWLSLFGRIWGISRNPNLYLDERTIPLDDALLPLARTNALIQHGSSDWYGPIGESIKREFGIPAEGTRWLHRLFAENLRMLVVAVLDAGSDVFIVQTGFRITRPSEPKAWKYEAVLDPDE